MLRVSDRNYQRHEAKIETGWTDGFAEGSVGLEGSVRLDCTEFRGRLGGWTGRVEAAAGPNFGVFLANGSGGDPIIIQPKGDPR